MLIEVTAFLSRLLTHIPASHKNQSRITLVLNDSGMEIIIDKIEGDTIIYRYSDSDEGSPIRWRPTQSKSTRHVVLGIDKRFFHNTNALKTPFQRDVANLGVLVYVQRMELAEYERRNN